MTNMEYSLIARIILKYRDYFNIPENEPLDGDHTEKLANILLNEFDYYEGNQTIEVYRRNARRLDYPQNLFDNKDLW